MCLIRLLDKCTFQVTAHVRDTTRGWDSASTIAAEAEYMSLC